MGIAFLFLLFLWETSAVYLDDYRFAFKGSFYSNPGTLNNFVNNFDPSNPIIPWWGPDGMNYFYFINVTVANVFQPNHPQEEDCLFGAKISTTLFGKLVDLDPDQQFTSEIYGMKVTITVGDSDYLISGDYSVSQLEGAWLKSLQPMNQAPSLGLSTSQRAAFWQSTIKNIVWPSTPPPSCSPVLQYLHQESKDAFSIKMNCEMYDNQNTSDTFGYGVLTGAIGPLYPKEHTSFVTRRLYPAEDKRNITNFASARVDFNSLFIDLGNSIQTKSYGGDSTIHILSSGLKVDNEFVIFQRGLVNTTRPFLDAHGGVIEIPLTPKEFALVLENPIVLLENGVPFLEEPDDGIFVYADTRSFRLKEPEQVPFYAYKFGYPLENYHFGLSLTPCPMPPEEDRVDNEPEDGIIVTKDLQTDQHGVAYLKLAPNLKDTQLPEYRKYMDSQIYFFSTNLPSAADACIISAVVYNEHHKISENPSWEEIFPILDVYYRLFPGMQEIFNLTDKTKFDEWAGETKRVLTLPWDHPRLMPVTRDLSPWKLNLLLNYIAHKEEEQKKKP